MSSEQDHGTLLPRALKYRYLAACVAIMCTKIDGQQLLAYSRVPTNAGVRYAVATGYASHCYRLDFTPVPLDCNLIADCLHHVRVHTPILNIQIIKINFNGEKSLYQTNIQVTNFWMSAVRKYFHDEKNGHYSIQHLLYCNISEISM